MIYFYSASVMGYGQGRGWHKNYNFPNFPRVTKTLTLKPKWGRPFAIIRVGKSVYNSVGLSNIGIVKWLNNFGHKDLSNITVSVHANNYPDLQVMFELLEDLNINGIEINLSCPNVVNNYPHCYFPSTKHALYLKLNYEMDPLYYVLYGVRGIRLNSIPLSFCGGSGKIAQKRNWVFIKKWGKKLNVAGCSFQSINDIKRLEDMGCTEIGIGSIILTNPKFIEMGL